MIFFYHIPYKTAQALLWRGSGMEIRQQKERIWEYLVCLVFFFSFFLSKSIFPQIIRIWMKKTRVICGDDYEAKNIATCEIA